MRAIGYVLRNPVSAGIRIMPYHYVWSSASLYFRPPENNTPGHRIGSLSYRARRNILRSQTNLPDDYLINDNGLILPECYVDIKYVENLFRSPARLMYALSRNENLEMELTGDILHKTKYTDDELTGTVENLCRQFFCKTSVYSLSIEDRYHLARMLYKRYGLSRKQLSRLTMTDPALLKNIL